ncbi:unnamed protein product [Prunus armeniaca]
MDFGSIWSRTCRVKMVVIKEIMPMVFIPPEWKKGEKERSVIQGGIRRKRRGGEEGQTTSPQHVNNTYWVTWEHVWSLDSTCEALF